ncbi:MAG: N-acetylmuramic acid 6-phosphate etherase [Firmicutes bacterium]|nr:N-acetylmuramic acid 6-phosphate etherase [Bacillota bacterium]
MQMNIESLATEQPNARSRELDSLSAFELINVMNEEDATVAQAVKEALPVIAVAVTHAAQALRSGGRLIYVGSGTSGRMGMLDASECRPTFGVSQDTVVAVMAGGASAFASAREGAEDDVEAGRQTIRDLAVTPNDLVVGISASGRTPFTIAALAAAREIGAFTVGLSCNQDALLSLQADAPIEVVTGSEVLTGSTRLKAGTAQKMVLNMISTGAMVLVGKVYKNYMVDMAMSNYKLQERAVDIVKHVLAVSEASARHSLEEAGGNIKVAIVMSKLGVRREVAVNWLDSAGGSVRATLTAHSAEAGSAELP